MGLREEEEARRLQRSAESEEESEEEEERLKGGRDPVVSPCPRARVSAERRCNTTPSCAVQSLDLAEASEWVQRYYY